MAEQQLASWLRKYDRPKSDKPSGSQRKREMLEGRVRKVVRPKPRERTPDVSTERVLITERGTPLYAVFRQSVRSGLRAKLGERAYKVLAMDRIGETSRYRVKARVWELKAREAA